MAATQHRKSQKTSRPEYHLITFDPGGITGWAHFVVDCRAFVTPEAKVLRYLKSWNCGEFTGTEHEVMSEAAALCYRHRYGYPTRRVVNTMDVVSEDFDLVQTLGGNNLLSPVRINTVIDWELNRTCGLRLNLQARQMRTSITPVRLKLFGFDRKWTKTGKGKDAFAAMQHGVVWLRRVKAQSRERAWILRDGIMPIRGNVQGPN